MQRKIESPELSKQSFENIASLEYVATQVRPVVATQVRPVVLPLGGEVTHSVDTEWERKSLLSMLLTVERDDENPQKIKFFFFPSDL